MSHIAAQVTLPHASGLPADVTVNTFHFDGDPSSPTDINEITLRLLEFYNEGGAGDPVAYYLAGLIQRTADVCTIQLYDMTQAKPRAPIETVFWQLEPAGSPTSFPSELAVCLSFQAAQQSGSPQARRRGRIYLGPLTQAVGVTTGGQPTRVATTPRDVFRTAALQLASSTTSAGVPWCVYSRTDGVVRPITNGWIDDDFDVQRRRGPEPTDRTTWTLSV